MNRKIAARCLAELGNLTRLDIYRPLVRAGRPSRLPLWPLLVRALLVSRDSELRKSPGAIPGFILPRYDFACVR